MKSVLGIVASPRKLGNSEMAVKEIVSQIEEPHQLKMLRLNDFDIQPCLACYRCLFGEGKCVQKDEFEPVLDAILQADGLILAAPTYFLGANAALKRFLDRGLAFYSHVDSLWGKPAVGIGIAGIPGKEGYTLLNIRSFLKLMLTDVKGTARIYGALPGEIFFSDGNREILAGLGAALFGSPLPETGPSCPQCGGDTFQFLGDQKVRCMLCSNDGEMKMGPKGPQFRIDRGDHELFLKKEDVIAHGEWLRGMKDRFSAEKKRLKEISLDYRKGWEWITPDRSSS